MFSRDKGPRAGWSWKCESWRSFASRGARVVGFSLQLLAPTAWAAPDWREFRGPNGQGLAPDSAPALSWSETRGVKWKTPLPGKGWSSPVVLSNQIWCSTATDQERSLHAVCLDADSGRIVRDILLFRVERPEQLTSELSGLASPTPVIEPGRVYFSFGTYGNAAIATDTGEVVWRNQELIFGHDNCGPGSSPILHGELCLLTCDGTETRSVVALDKRTGKIRWRTPRSNLILTGPGASKSFGTPIVATVAGRDQLISPGAHRVSAYDLRDGKEIWAVDLPGWAIVPRPVWWNDLVYVCTGGTKPELWAIRANGRGVVNETHVVWKCKRQVPMVASPVLVGERLYMVSEGGIATALDARSGKEIWSERIGGQYYASPVATRERVYFFSDDGRTSVVAAGPVLQVLATNRLEAGCMATPALVGTALYVRSKTHLYRIEP